MGRGAWQATVHGIARVGHDLTTKPPPPSLIQRSEKNAETKENSQRRPDNNLVIKRGQGPLVSSQGL